MKFIDTFGQFSISQKVENKLASYKTSVIHIEMSPIIIKKVVRVSQNLLRFENKKKEDKTKESYCCLTSM